jgi:hypothetical protein
MARGVSGCSSSGARTTIVARRLSRSSVIVTAEYVTAASVTVGFSALSAMPGSPAGRSERFASASARSRTPSLKRLVG